MGTDDLDISTASSGININQFSNQSPALVDRFQHNSPHPNMRATAPHFKTKWAPCDTVSNKLLIISRLSKLMKFTFYFEWARIVLIYLKVKIKGVRINETHLYAKYISSLSVAA